MLERGEETLCHFNVFGGEIEEPAKCTTLTTIKRSENTHTRNIKISEITSRCPNGSDS